MMVGPSGLQRNKSLPPLEERPRPLPSPFDPVDREALERAMEIASRDRLRKKQLDWKVEHDGWFDTAVFASYVCQHDALRLKPWELPPLYGGPLPGDSGLVRASGLQAKRLLNRMLAAGLSRYEPDPIEALRRLGK